MLQYLGLDWLAMLLTEGNRSPAALTRRPLAAG